MKSLQDALYNWLTIKVVADARPDDEAAKETTELFSNILKQEHNVEIIRVSKDASMYMVVYNKAGEEKTAKFPVELIEFMLLQINQEPEKYVNYPK